MENAMMRAAIVTREKTLVVKDVPIPKIGEYEALVRISYGATCAGTDQRVIEHGHPRKLEYPAILGHESVGRVVEVGAKVRHFQMDDLIARVGAKAIPELDIHLCWGGFAGYGVARDWRAMREDGLPEGDWVKARVNQVIPPDIDERVAPMIITWRETLSYVWRIGARPGTRTFVIGSGANALSIARHLVTLGAHVAVLGSQRRAAQVAMIGADAFGDYRTDDLPGWLLRTFPHGIDLVIDAFGAPEQVNAALRYLNAGATVGVYGWHGRAEYALNPFFAARSFRVYCDGYDEPDAHDAVVEGIRSGALDARVYYDMDNPVPLTDIARAYEDLRARKAVKYLIDCGR